MFLSFLSFLHANKKLKLHHHNLINFVLKNNIRNINYSLKYFTRRNYRTKIREYINSIKKDINNFDNIVFDNYKRFSNPWNWF